ncbi:MAG: hypothetical protein ABIA93_04290 [Candidatus Woesearchaeota archaeon]
MYFRAHAISHGIPPGELPSILEIARMVEVRDANNHVLGKWSPMRLPISSMQTFRKLCNDYNVEYDSVNLEHAYTIGERPFKEEVIAKSGLLPGARETLDFLVSKGDECHLATKGEDEVQSMKLRVLGVYDEPWFRNGRGHRIDIVDVKDAALYRRIAQGYKPENVWVVGDSMASEVLPGLEAGFNVIHIEGMPIPLFNKPKFMPDPNTYIQMKSIGEIKDKYDALINGGGRSIIKP